ncbi:MAG: single-stranded DNA-binding protein [Bacteroidia bacterium]|nr:single-stranded DNA-binding protein [Bacteroidia bacterium]MDW8134368.1 single-stranded DNA-binding protein [Bacteroidia bacterium]
MYLKLTVAGRLGRDAEVRSAGNGQVIRFSIPHTQRTASGEERTLWIECSYWRNPGESTEVAKVLRKGTIALVEGTPHVRLYTKQDNTLGVSFECRVSALRILAYSPLQEAESPATTPTPVEEDTIPEEPIPPEIPGSEDLPF